MDEKGSDPVKAPVHYAGDGEVDCKRAARSMAEGYDRAGVSTEAAYWSIAALKYLWRWPLKGKAQDLEKAGECIELAHSAHEAKPKPKRISSLGVYLAPGEVSLKPLQEWESLSASGTVEITEEGKQLLGMISGSPKPSPSLKPCPFCGEEPDMVKFEHVPDSEGKCRSWYVECANDSCGVNPVTDVRGSRESAAELWNGRPCGC